jgi:hypothetical protein
MSLPTLPNQQGSPTVDLAFFTTLLAKNPKIQKVHNNGTSIVYVMKGTKPLPQRMIIIRQIGGVVDFEFAMGTCLKLKCTEDLLEWLKEYRSWKEGAYFVK